MNVRLRRALVVASLVCIALFAYGFYQAGRDVIVAPPLDMNITAPHGGVAAGERIESKSWKIRYDRMVSNADQTVVDLYGVHDGTIFRTGRPYLRVRATHVTVNTLTHDFTALGPLRVVTVASNPERSFDTDSATWSDATQTLTFAHHTTIESGADEPMKVGSLTLNVKTGEVLVTDAFGSIRVK